MTKNFFADDVGDVLSSAIPESGDELYAVNPTRESVPDIVFQLHDEADAPAVNLLAADGVLKDVMADFVVAGHAADLIAEDRLSVRLLSEPPEASLLVSPELLVSLVHADGTVGGLTATDVPFVSEAAAHYAERWDRAEAFGLRTPPISRVRETLAAEIGADVADDFDAILAELPAARGDGEGLDEVTISILAAARHGVLLYDISRWGEDVGLASKATFSRTKSRLEDSEVIRTEKVPIDVGRPRLRLRLTDDGFRSAEVPKLTDRVRERLGAEA